jgi:hypothetical protein
MGFIGRQAGAPILNGETASGTEMEAELSTIHSLVNGNIDNTNIISNAAIAGTKIADTSIAGVKLTADTVTLSKMIPAAVPKAYWATSTTTAVATTSATVVDIPDISSWTVTPGATTDIIELDLTVTMDKPNSNANGWEFGFDIGGADTGSLAMLRFSNDGASNGVVSCTTHWAQNAGVDTAITIKPTYKRVVGSDSTSFGGYVGSGITIIFRGRVIPIK